MHYILRSFVIVSIIFRNKASACIPIYLPFDIELVCFCSVYAL